MMKRSLPPNKDIQYKTYCESLQPGKQIVTDLLATVRSRPADADRLDLPVTAEFSEDFFRAVYTYYVKQIRHNLLAEEDLLKVGNNAEMVLAVNALKDLPDTQSLAKAKPLSGFQDLLRRNLIIGEIFHECIAPKKFLIENMGALKTAGCDTLYMEHLYYDEHQHLLDRFNETDVLDKSISDSLKEFDRGYCRFMGYQNNPDKLDTDQREAFRELYLKEWNKYNFTALVQAAHIAGLRIVAIDMKDIYKTQSSNKIFGKDKIDRVICGDYSFANIIQHDLEARPNHGSWIALIGASHVTGLEKLLHKKVTTVMVGDNYQKRVEISARDQDISVGAGENSLLLPKSDVVICLPVGESAPSMQQMFKHTDPVVAKLDFLISMLPTLTLIEPSPPHANFNKLMAAIAGATQNQNTGDCLKAIIEIAKADPDEKKSGFFGKKNITPNDPRILQLLNVISLQLTDKNLGLRDFKENIVAALAAHAKTTPRMEPHSK